MLEYVTAHPLLILGIIVLIISATLLIYSTWHLRRYLKLLRHFEKRATEVFGTSGQFNAWLGTPIRALGGKMPEELLKTRKGIKQLLDILGRIEHGVYS
jgi:putative toxin-antitoxin system antitoxin component (TIGR02293 family)